MKQTIQDIEYIDTYSEYLKTTNELTVFITSELLLNPTIKYIFKGHIKQSCKNYKFINLLTNTIDTVETAYFLKTINYDSLKKVHIYDLGNQLYTQDSCGNIPTNTFSLAPNAIFMDTYGHWSFDTTDSNSAVLQKYNARSIVNYLYLAKTLSEHSRKDGKNISISLFQLNGGNIPIKDETNTYPMQYIPDNVKENFSKLATHYNTTNINYNNTSQFVTYIFGEPLLNAAFTNTPFKNDRLNEYIEPSNSNTNITNADFNTTIEIFNWTDNKIELLKKCNINSILWGSDHAFGIAPFKITSKYETGASWVLFDKIKKYKEDLSGIRMAGFNNLNNDLSYNKLDNNSFINDSVAIYTPQTKSDSAINSINKKTFRYLIWANILTLFNDLDILNNSKINKPVKPYIAHYIYNGSSDGQSGGSSATFKYTYLTNTIFLLAYCCLRTEIFGAKYYPSEKIYGDICISPDFYNAFSSDELWSDVQGKASNSNLFNSSEYKTDQHLKSMALNICNIYKTYLTKCSWNKCNACFDCPGYDLPSNIQICDKCTTCNDCDINQKIIAYFKILHDWIDKNWDSFNHIIDMDTNCIKSVNALIGFFLNTCGPHVNAGWDIGWKFNRMNNGIWANDSYGANDFTKNIIPMNKLNNYIDKNGWRDKKKAGIVDNTLYYLQNNVYGDTEQVSVRISPPIFNSF